MMDEGDDGARVGVWVTVGVITLLLFGLIGGLAIRQMNKGADKAQMAKPGTTATVGARGASADELLDAPVRGELLTKIYFESGSAELPVQAHEAVAVAGVALGQAPASTKLVLSGFHDASGDPAKNAELAKQRAKALRAAFAAAGLDESRVQLRKPESTKGDGKPEEARRVEVHLVN
jgi:outer membrane protein OmpA-like peptidoglycan-associated protein